MSKEYLEAFKNLKQELYYSPNQIPYIDKWHETIEQALQRLEAIDNANPSEALKELDYIGKNCYEEAGDVEEDCILYAKNYIGFDTIKQALLKAQEQDFNYKNIVIPFFDELVKLLGINDTDEMLDKIKEQEKVLEIIKKKQFNYDRFNYVKKNWQTTKEQVDVYNSGISNCFKYTEEEFDLLKRYFG